MFQIRQFRNFLKKAIRDWLVDNVVSSIAASRIWLWGKMRFLEFKSLKGYDLGFLIVFGFDTSDISSAGATFSRFWIDCDQNA